MNTPLHRAKIFISGGAGTIGTALVERLLEKGAKLFVGDLKGRPKHWPKEVNYFHGDLNTITQQELLDFNPEYFFHLAATFECTHESEGFWDSNFHNNIQLSHYLTSCLKDFSSLKKIIFASSYLVYDPSLYLYKKPHQPPFRICEEADIKPRNLCGVSKLYHEHELLFLQNRHQSALETISARIFRSYGLNSRDVISRWIRAALRNEPIKIFSSEGKFDFIFADDVAEGLLRLSEAEVKGTVNLGKDRARSIAEVIQILKQHFPKLSIIEEQSDLPLEASQANMDHFKECTGWHPTHELEDAIPKIIEYEKEQLHL